MHADRMLRVLAQLSFALAPLGAASEPIDLNDPMPRSVLFQVESSTNPATVGQSFGGPSLPATYSASGGTGTLVIPVESHEALRGGLTPVPGSFTPIVISIDLATHAATSQPAGGQATDGGNLSFSWSLHALTTNGTAGFVGPNFTPPLLCTSQQQIDEFCQFYPPICGKTCIQVAGSAFDPASGKVNLVGGEDQSGCDGTVCQGPFTVFTLLGDLRLLEANQVPAVPWTASPLLALGLLAASAVALLRRRARAVLLLALALLPSAARALTPLDPSDPTPRSVLVELETSPNLATVGASFGPPQPATYSASGVTGTLLIPAASHQALRGVSSATAFVISIDLATGAATSQPTSGGSIIGPGQAAVFVQQALGTGTLAGFMDGQLGIPSFCTSQADVEAACQINPIPEVCNQICVVVPGAVFDPGSGKLNLVGAEQRQICGGTGCFGTHTAFSHYGDLRVSELTAVPALPWAATSLLARSLLAMTMWWTRRSTR
jgi:hypothetical protein